MAGEMQMKADLDVNLDSYIQANASFASLGHFQTQIEDARTQRVPEDEMVFSFE